MRWLHEPVASFPFLFWSYCFLKSLRLVEDQAMHYGRTEEHPTSLLPSCKGVSRILSSLRQVRMSSSLEVPQVPRKSWPGRKAVSRTLRRGVGGGSGGGGHPGHFCSSCLQALASVHCGAGGLFKAEAVEGCMSLCYYLLRRRIYDPA